MSRRGIVTPQVLSRHTWLQLLPEVASLASRRPGGDCTGVGLAREAGGSDAIVPQVIKQAASGAVLPQPLPLSHSPPHLPPHQLCLLCAARAVGTKGTG